jgi:hypothetical protein
MPDQLRGDLIRALENDDVPVIEALIHDHPDLLNASKVRPAVTAARSLATAERLLGLGADLEAVSAWWARGMYTREVAPDVARFLVERGATLTPHAAAGLGLRRIDVARKVKRRAAVAAFRDDVDARDEDHESTPAQSLIGEAPEVVRFLLESGATPDIFLAAALGDRSLAERS